MSTAAPKNSIPWELVDAMLAFAVGLTVYIAIRYFGVSNPTSSIPALVSGLGLYCTLWYIRLD